MTAQQTYSDITALTAEIVSCYVRGNQILAEKLPELITSVHGTLSQIEAPAPAAPPKAEPAVPIKASVKPGHVTCLECGFKGKMLKRHLMSEHGLSPDEYRKKWGLAPDHPLVAPNYALRRADLAKAHGLGRKPGSKANG